MLQRNAHLNVFAAFALCMPMFFGVGLAQGQSSLVQPFHERIDRLVEHARPPAPPSTDAEFLRRVSLDLVGVIPTADEARAFLDDPSPYKRARLVDRMLESSGYARNMATVFDAILMERRPDANVPRVEWEEFLRAAFARNEPYDQLVRTILKSDGREPANRAAAKFYLDRAGESNVLVRDLGRIFLGRDMQCAQCHDHPLIDDYKQAEAQRSLFVTDPRLKDIVAVSHRPDQVREEMVEATVYNRLKGSLGPFVNQFAGAPGQLQDSGQSTVHQALFVANGDTIQSWLAPSGANLTARLAKLTEGDALGEELYLAILSRRPSKDERQEVVEYLAPRTTDRDLAIRELAWAILASTEFRFNH